MSNCAYERVRHESIRAVLKHNIQSISILFIFDECGIFSYFFEKTRLKRFSATEIGLARYKQVQSYKQVKPRFLGFKNSTNTTLGASLSWQRISASIGLAWFPVTSCSKCVKVRSRGARGVQVQGARDNGIDIRHNLAQKHKLVVNFSRTKPRFWNPKNLAIPIPKVR